jgi:hypothetical protein
MRRLAALTGLLFFASRLPAAASADDPILPATSPGYELRTLDVRKPVLFDVNGARVRVSLPIFLYYPTSQFERQEAARLLRQAYDDAVRLGRQPEWTAAELQRMIAALDASLQLLERKP